MWSLEFMNLKNIDRDSRPQMFFKIDVPKNFANFTENVCVGVTGLQLY